MHWIMVEMPTRASILVIILVIIITTYAGRGLGLKENINSLGKKYREKFSMNGERNYTVAAGKIADH